MRFLEECNGDIILEYLLSCTPELNPIEMQWSPMKRILSAKIFETLDQMKYSINKMFCRKKITPVKMF